MTTGGDNWRRNWCQLAELAPVPTNERERNLNNNKRWNKKNKKWYKEGHKYEGQNNRTTENGL